MTNSFNAQKKFFFSLSRHFLGNQTQDKQRNKEFKVDGEVGMLKIGSFWGIGIGFLEKWLVLVEIIGMGLIETLSKERQQQQQHQQTSHSL